MDPEKWSEEFKEQATGAVLVISAMQENEEEAIEMAKTHLLSWFADQ